MTDKSLCDSCTNIGCEFQSGIVRTKCAFYMPPQLEPDNCGNYVVQDSTTKNDIRDNRVKDELERVKDELEPTTKNDLGVDVISRADALRVAKNEYLRGWHDALCKALCEEYSIHCEEGNFSVIQEETITGLGLSMDCAVGKDVESYMSAIPSVTPQKSKTGYLSIDDVMSVFDDFMRGDVDEAGTETFLKMLKDKTESEG